MPCPRLQAIQGNTFAYCKSLEYVQLPKSILHLEGSAFVGCVAMRNIYLPDSIRTIGVQCFRDCVRLQSISLPPSLERLQGMVFWGCERLTSVTLPPCITTSMMMMSTMTTAPTTDENVMQENQPQSPRTSQIEEQLLNQEEQQPLEVVLTMSRKQTREGDKVTPILDTTAVRFFCDTNRGGLLRYVIKDRKDDDDDDVVVKYKKKKDGNKLKSYPPALWPLIFHRIFNTMEYDDGYINKLYDIYDGYSDRCDVRKASVVYFFLVHGTIQDLCCSTTTTTTKK